MVPPGLLAPPSPGVSWMCGRCAASGACIPEELLLLVLMLAVGAHEQCRRVRRHVSYMASAGIGSTGVIRAVCVG